MATNVTATDLTQGPGMLFTAAFGATEPADSTVNTALPASTWTAVGGTQDGLKLTVDQAWAELEVDQLVTTSGRRMTKQDYMVETTLAEPTLENLALALNGGTTVTSSGYSTWEPDYNATSATQPTYKALALDGWAPGGNYTRRVYVRKAISTDGIEVAYTKEKQTVFSVKFGAHWVSDSIAPIHIVDQTS